MDRESDISTRPRRITTRDKSRAANQQQDSIGELWPVGTLSSASPAGEFTYELAPKEAGEMDYEPVDGIAYCYLVV